MTALLECQDLTKSFGGVPVLKGISLDLEPGTVISVSAIDGATAFVAPADPKTEEAETP